MWFLLAWLACLAVVARLPFAAPARSASRRGWSAGPVPGPMVLASGPGDARPGAPPGPCGRDPDPDPGRRTARRRGPIGPGGDPGRSA